MSESLALDTTDFRVEIGDDGIAEVILGAPGAMPVTDARGHAEIARLWSRLDAHPKVRAARVSTAKPDVYPDCEAVGVEVFAFKDPAP